MDFATFGHSQASCFLLFPVFVQSHAYLLQTVALYFLLQIDRRHTTLVTPFGTLSPKPLWLGLGSKATYTGNMVWVTTTTLLRLWYLCCHGLWRWHVKFDQPCIYRVWCLSGQSCEPWESVFGQNSWSTCGTGRPVCWCGWGHGASCWPTRWTHAHRCDTCAPSPPEEQENVENVVNKQIRSHWTELFCGDFKVVEPIVSFSENLYKIMPRNQRLIWWKGAVIKSWSSISLSVNIIPIQLRLWTSSYNILIYNPANQCATGWCFQPKEEIKYENRILRG